MEEQFEFVPDERHESDVFRQRFLRQRDVDLHLPQRLPRERLFAANVPRTLRSWHVRHALRGETALQVLRRVGRQGVHR